MRAALGVVGAGRRFTSTQRRRSARGALAAGLALTLGVAFVAPASAQTPTPATQGSASAYGLQATGLVPIPATPTVSVSTPGQQQQITLPVAAAPLAVNGTLTARAECNVEPTVSKRLASTPLTPNNCDGFARTEGLAVLLSGGALPSDPLAPAPSLVSADVIEGEAVARCVGGRGQVATGFNLTDVRIGGNPVALVNDTVSGVVNLLGPNGLLAPLVTITQNETGTLPNGGIFVNALHIRILPGAGGIALPGTLGGPVDIIVSHAEARMPTPCGVAAVAGLAVSRDLGGGPADLPRTGANQMPAVPLALGMLATAVVLHRVNRRARRASD